MKSRQFKLEVVSKTVPVAGKPQISPKIKALADEKSAAYTRVCGHFE